MTNKFKVYDLKEKSWVKALDILNYLWARNRRTTGLDEVLLDPLDGDEYKVCHFTGLKDRNGKEIYENDILEEKQEANKEIAGFTPNVGFVYFAAGSFMIDGDGQLFDHILSETPDVLEDYLVIGNIFENPELLK